jgi:hypothetical protein
MASPVKIPEGGLAEKIAAASLAEERPASLQHGPDFVARQGRFVSDEPAPQLYHA